MLKAGRQANKGKFRTRSAGGHRKEQSHFVLPTDVILRRSQLSAHTFPCPDVVERESINR